jgi:dihydroorotate dehydrogenase
MVNKGFKNQGIKAVVKKLRPYKFDLPVGISIGKTNIIEIDDLESGVSDITAAFKIAEKSSLKHSYYELNISCPNVTGKLSFYDLNNLESLLTSIDTLVLSRPVFMKLPISKTDKDFLKILKVISKHKISGIVIGNLQTNRHDPAIDPSEADKFLVGNFSGKPTEKRSNELIALAYQKYGNKLVIIGCGGIFSASDAYAKIKAGAALVQLITGMIYKGPQLISEINHDLDKLLKADGYKHISEAVGKGN